MSRTTLGNLAGRAAHGRDELDVATTSPNDAILDFIKSNMDRLDYHTWFNSVFDRCFLMDPKRYTAELRAKRAEIAEAQSENDKRGKDEALRIYTGQLSWPPKARAGGEPQDTGTAAATAYGQADLRQPEFGSAEWFADVRERPF